MSRAQVAYADAALPQLSNCEPAALELPEADAGANEVLGFEAYVAQNFGPHEALQERAAQVATRHKELGTLLPVLAREMAGVRIL